MGNKESGEISGPPGFNIDSKTLGRIRNGIPMGVGHPIEIDELTGVPKMP
jgi:hypothetical protein